MSNLFAITALIIESSLALQLPFSEMSALGGGLVCPAPE